MSLIVTVWTTEGIVMGSDSRISFSSQIAPNIPVNIQTGHYFDTQEKTFICPNNCGISTCGAASLLSYLTTNYNNLIYSCRNCNGEKSNLYEGDISKSPYENQRFYDPVKTDYNTIFYRNECGTICSDDSKGKSMILDLKLYRPINNLAWICEQLNELSDKLHALQLAETDPERKALIKDAEIEALRYYKDCQQIHTANFNNKSFSIKDIDL